MAFRTPVRPGAAARLLEQRDLADDGGAIEGLDHVVEGEARGGDRRQRLHLDPGLARDPRGRGDDRLAALPDELDVDLDGLERERMTEGHDLGRALGRLDPRQARDRERVALGEAPFERASNAAAAIATAPRATAIRRVAPLAPTSTIRARPRASTCRTLRRNGAAPLGRRGLSRRGLSVSLMPAPGGHPTLRGC